MLPNPKSDISAVRWAWSAPSSQEKRQTGGSKVLVLHFGPEARGRASSCGFEGVAHLFWEAMREALPPC